MGNILYCAKKTHAMLAVTKHSTFWGFLFLLSSLSHTKLSWLVLERSERKRSLWGPHHKTRKLNLLWKSLADDFRALPIWITKKLVQFYFWDLNYIQLGLIIKTILGIVFSERKWTKFQLSKTALDWKKQNTLHTLSAFNELSMFFASWSWDH